MSDNETELEEKPFIDTEADMENEVEETNFNGEDEEELVDENEEEVEETATER